MLLPLLFTLATAHEVDLYVGTYTERDGSRGIYRARLDARTGALSVPELAAETTSPSYLALGKDRLYAVNEKGEGEATAYRIERDGSLTRLNAQPTVGAYPCHLSLDRECRNLLVANYGGSVTCLPIAGNGSLLPPSDTVLGMGVGPNLVRQTGPHLHSVRADPRGRFAYTCDLGADAVMAYRLDSAKGTIRPGGAAAAKPGAGPRHLAFGPGGRFLYVNNELDNTVTAYAVDGGTGDLAPLESLSTLPDGFAGVSHSAEIVVHKDGHWLVVSNRGDDSLAVFAVAKDGRLTLHEIVPTEAKEPRGFEFDPSGRWLVVAGQNSDLLVVRPFDPRTGHLGPVASRASVPKPTCVVFRR